MKTKEMPAQSPLTRLSLKRILVPTDFSPLSKKALQYAQRFAENFHAEVILVHVIEPEVTPAFDGYMISPPPMLNSSDASEKKALKTLAMKVRMAGVERVESNVRRGLASHEIVDAARDFNVDLIVIATHGYTGWKHFCIGSTAERVVRAAPCPVLVVREKEHEFC